MGRKRTIPEEVRKAVAREINRGREYRDVSKEFGVSLDSIHTIMRESLIAHFNETRAKQRIDN